MSEQGLFPSLTKWAGRKSNIDDVNHMSSDKSCQKHVCAH